MDPICHTLTGLAMGHAGLTRRTPLAITTLVLAANAPDIDVVTMVTTDVWMFYRRGWTHGPVAFVVLPLAIAGLVLWYDRAVRRPRDPRAEPARAGPLLALAVIGMLSHSLLDYMNTFGIRLLMPFSGHWFFGDALYIVDPWLSGVLALGALAAWRWGRYAETTRRANRLVFAAATLYVAGMYASGLWARQVVHSGLARAGRAEARFMVSPVIANPLRREVLIDLGDRYEKGFVDFEPAPHFRPSGYGVEIHADDPLAREAAKTRLGEQYLQWARFPFFVVDRTTTPPRVQLNDARYSGPMGTDGWSATLVPVPEVPAGMTPPPPAAR